MNPVAPPGSADERILVFIPMYNCARQIPRVIAKFSRRLQSLIHGVVIIDNGSRDGGRECAIAAVADLRVPVWVLANEDNYNLGGSHKVAFDFALDNGFSHVAVLHGDDQAHAGDLERWLVNGWHRRADCLLGSRFMPGARRVGYAWHRTAGNHVFNVLFSLAARRPLSDLGSGLNLFAVGWMRDRFYRLLADELTFNYFLVFWLSLRRVRVRFLPIRWSEEDQVSNVRLVRQTLRMVGILSGYLRGGRSYLERYHGRFTPDGYRARIIHTHIPPAGLP